MKTKIKILLIAVAAMVMNVNAFGQGCVSVCKSADAGPNKMICGNTPSCVTIGAGPTCLTGSGCGTVSSYSWAPGGATTCTPTVCPTVTTIYTLYVTLSGSCCCDGATGACASSCSTVLKGDNVTVSVNLSAECFNPYKMDPVENKDINLVPNKLNGKVLLYLDKITTKTAVYIYDSKGKEVLSEINIDTSKTQLEYDLSSLGNEEYFVLILEGNDIRYFQKQG